MICCGTYKDRNCMNVLNLIKHDTGLHFFSVHFQYFTRTLNIKSNQSPTSESPSPMAYSM